MAWNDAFEEVAVKPAGIPRMIPSVPDVVNVSDEVAAVEDVAVLEAMTVAFPVHPAVENNLSELVA